jgi:hypothetical protein
MPKVRVVDATTVSPERVLAAARDFSQHRAELWPDVHLEHLKVHELGDTYADVTEGNPWPIGVVWERLRYDWSQPDAVRGVVIASNLFHPGSTWELWVTATPQGSRVELRADRRLRRFKGWLLYPLFPLGLARQAVAGDLRHFLATLEADEETLTRTMPSAS